MDNQVWCMARYCHAVNWWNNNGHFNKELYEIFLAIRYADK
jgi:hypothetical protein